MKHTPGPWRISPRSRYLIRPIEGLFNIAQVMNDWGGPLEETAKANARLIAAAPDLLEVCKEAFNYLDKPYTSEYGNVEIIGLLRQTISKAEGRE